MAFTFVQASRKKHQKYDEQEQQEFPNGRGLYLVIKFSAAESRVFRFLALSVLLALFIVSLPYFESSFKGSSIASRALLIGYDDDDSSSPIRNLNNYKFVYLGQSDSIDRITKNKEGKVESEIEIDIDEESKLKSPTRRRLFAFESDARKAALEKFEDVLLEPPRAASGKSRRYLQRTRYLPDLMGDSLEGYPRHVFIDVGLPEKEGGSGTEWFAKNYPTRNKKFEMFKIDTVSSDQDPSSSKVVQEGISEWVVKNVRSEDYVVMKAEAEMVEEMMKSKTIQMVDELFLECKPQTHGGRKVNGSRRAYWQCLALYGQLRDEGVAVHQWWG